MSDINFDPNEFMKELESTGQPNPIPQPPQYQQPVPPLPRQQYAPPTMAPSSMPPPQHYGGYQNAKPGVGKASPPHGKIYNTFSQAKRIWNKTITITPEGVQYLLSVANQLQNPGYKLKLKVLEYSPERLAQLQAQYPQMRAIGSAYFNLDDGSRKFGPQQGGSY